MEQEFSPEKKRFNFVNPDFKTLTIVFLALAVLAFAFNDFIMPKIRERLETEKAKLRQEGIEAVFTTALNREDRRVSLRAKDKDGVEKLIILQLIGIEDVSE